MNRCLPTAIMAALVLFSRGLPAQSAGNAAPCDRTALLGEEECLAGVVTATASVGRVGARGLLVLPSPAPAKFVVAIIGGGLVGHVAFSTDIWRAMCARMQCGLMHFALHEEQVPLSPSMSPGRNAALGGADALIAVLDSIATKTGRPELRQVKLALYGFSAAGSFAQTFASLHPERTLTVIRHHSHLRGLPIDTTALARVPNLIIASVKDASAGVDDARLLWEGGRRRGAPWTLAVEAEREHTSLDSWYWGSDLMWHWIGSLQALSDRAVTSEQLLSGGWHGDPVTGTVFAARGRQESAMANWLPDSVTAEAWRRHARPAAR